MLQLYRAVDRQLFNRIFLGATQIFTNKVREFRRLYRTMNLPNDIVQIGAKSHDPFSKIGYRYISKFRWEVRHIGGTKRCRGNVFFDWRPQRQWTYGVC